ncbi:VanZ like family protein [compost metagenome]
MYSLYTISHFLEFDRFNVNVWIINLIGNIGVFVPFGILLPLICKGKLIKSYIVFLSGLILLEAIQLFSRRGGLDIDDVILNTVGFIIGFGFFRIIKGWLK